MIGLNSGKKATFSISSTQEMMTISAVGPVQILVGRNPKEKRNTPFKDKKGRSLILKELQEKKYLFPDSDLLGMLDCI